MRSEVKYSFIVPMYNVENYIEQCIESILMQDYDSYELLLINDGSTDRTEEKCRKYLGDERIRYFYKENGGLSDARNFGIERSGGEYLIFMDSDDFYECAFLDALNCLIEAGDPDITVINHMTYYERTGKKTVRKRRGDIARTDFFRYNIYKASACDKIVKSSLIKENGVFFPRGYLSEDILWCGKLLLYNPGISYFDLPVYAYRQRSGSISHSAGEKNISDIFKMVSELLAGNCPEIVRTYLSFEYACLLFMISKQDQKSIKANREKFRKYDFLLSYAVTGKALAVRYLYRFLGYGLTCRVLKIKARLDAGKLGV